MLTKCLRTQNRRDEKEKRRKYPIYVSTGEASQELLEDSSDPDSAERIVLFSAGIFENDGPPRNSFEAPASSSKSKSVYNPFQGTRERPRAAFCAGGSAIASVPRKESRQHESYGLASQPATMQLALPPAPVQLPLGCG
jgi:hypothetical protein